MSFALARLSDRDDIVSLIQTSGLPDLQADGWTVNADDISAKAVLARIQSGQWRIIASRDNQNVLRGVALFAFANDTDGWELKLVVVDKSLTAQQRINGFSGLMNWIGAHMPADTPCYGVTKPGGKLDNYLSSKLPPSGRAVLSDGNVIWRSTAGEMAALL